MTGQRRLVLEELRRNSTHPTAEDLYLKVKRRMPHVSLGTIYRNLEVLTEAGLARRVGPAADQMRFDACVENHYHIRCTSCGRVDDVELAGRPAIEAEIARLTEYDVSGCSLEFLGLCPSCRKGNGGHRGSRANNSPRR
jgi:Fe2+ or Zn2+ uptake regulation protein